MPAHTPGPLSVEEAWEKYEYCREDIETSGGSGDCGLCRAALVAAIQSNAITPLQAEHAEMKALLETLVDYEGVRGAAPSVTQRARAFLARIGAP